MGTLYFAFEVVRTPRSEHGGALTMLLSSLRASLASQQPDRLI